MDTTTEHPPQTDSMESNNNPSVYRSMTTNNNTGTSHITQAFLESTHLFTVGRKKQISNYGDLPVKAWRDQRPHPVTVEVLMVGGSAFTSVGKPLLECSCGNCRTMTTGHGSVCCQEISLVREKTLEDGHQCITRHEEFIGNCLNRHLLEVSLFEFVYDEGPLDDNEPPHKYVYF